MNERLKNENLALDDRGIVRRVFYATAAIFIGGGTALAAQDKPTIEWELRHPFKMFGNFSDEDRYFRDSVDRRLWDYRRDIFVDPACDKTRVPISCSEISLGAVRLRTMRELLAPGADGRDTSHLRDAWLATATAWNNKTRRYDKSLLDQSERVGIKVRLTGSVIAAMTCQWSADGIP